MNETFTEEEQIKRVADSYEDYPYQNNIFSQTHPDALATVGRLFGMDTPPLHNARVLELGCSDGINLLSMAMTLPEATFVGIDISDVEIRKGVEQIRTTGIKNVELHRMSINDIPEDFGEFDYIITHGIFSWVPPSVQQAILEVSKRHLAPNGLAYISYNTYPGWHFRGMVREMLKFHSERFGPVDQRIAEARGFMDFIANTLTPDKSPIGKFLEAEREQMQKWPNYYLRHDTLSEINQPFYFHDFVKKTYDAGLLYVGDAEVQSMFTWNLPPEVEEVVKRIAPDLVTAEQYMDFLRNRLFRQSIFTHKEARLSRNITIDKLMRMRFASPLELKSAEEDVFGNTLARFESDKKYVNSTSPLVKVALRELQQAWPQSVHFPELIRTTLEKLGGNQDDQGRMLVPAKLAESLALELNKMFAKKMIELHTMEFPFVTEVSARPKASALVRWAAQRTPTVANLRHQIVTLDGPSRSIIPYLDGMHDIASIVIELKGAIARGEISLAFNGRPILEYPDADQLLRTEIQRYLQRFAKRALLAS